MRQEPEFFGDHELHLLYIGKRLNQALEVEKILTDAEIDYAVEVEEYIGGVIFRSVRKGAFFYVMPEDHERAAETLRAGGVAEKELAAFVPPESLPEQPD